MLQYRDYIASQERPLGPVPIWIVKWLVAPVVRTMARVLPPLGRAMGRTTGGLQGQVFRTRERGDHRAAYTAALQGMARQDRLRGRRSWLPDMLEFQLHSLASSLSAFLVLAKGEGAFAPARVDRDRDAACYTLRWRAD